MINILLEVIHYEAGSFAYIKIKDGCATVAKINQAYIIGIYNINKKYKCDGKELILLSLPSPTLKNFGNSALLHLASKSYA